MNLLVEELHKYRPAKDTYLSIGVFDGVHKGHRHLLEVLADQSNTNGALTGVVTFLNHPREILNPGFSQSWLTTTEERYHLMKEVGIDLIIPIAFTEETSRIRANQFTDLLQKHLRMRGLVVGPDFALGQNREGDVNFLSSLGKEKGFDVKIVNLLQRTNRPISSSLIRKALSTGDLVSVFQLLGRNYSVSGKVIAGDGRGATLLGYPTANLEIPEYKAIPKDGIYAAMATIDGKYFQAAVSLGVQPTFPNSPHKIEAFILDLNANIYGKTVQLEFIERLRDELTFPTKRDLISQIEKDVIHTRHVLTEREHEK
ncbi:MAG: riboflavin kinase / FMN adenylyltransferase [Chloroflexi bacterium]|jgi:riboflavin kinase/FMN adenylyltransferase|nr:MAG: riboflavin kinase / FMN adenylyltransferase [Chloroflexota bacterium]